MFLLFVEAVWHTDYRLKSTLNCFVVQNIFLVFIYYWYYKEYWNILVNAYLKLIGAFDFKPEFCFLQFFTVHHCDIFRQVFNVIKGEHVILFMLSDTAHHANIQLCLPTLNFKYLEQSFRRFIKTIVIIVVNVYIFLFTN